MKLVTDPKLYKPVCVTCYGWCFRHEMLALEKPVEAAMLISLTGVNCVYENQWHCTLKKNAEKLALTMRGLSTLSIVANAL